MVAHPRSKRSQAPAHPGRRRTAAVQPDVDDRLVMPETRYEILDGKVEYVPPSDPLHGMRHSRLSALLEAYAAPGFGVASDMLTRTSEKDDVAPDGSIFPLGADPRTGGRRLEVLAFEVVSTQRLGYAGKKARTLAKRGVRQVFAINVKRDRVLVWSKATDAWKPLLATDEIEDPALVMPLPVAALLEAGKAEDAVARALLAKGNPILRDRVERGVHQGKLEALFRILTARGLTISPAARRRIQSEDDAACVDGWLDRAAICASVDELLRH